MKQAVNDRHGGPGSGKWCKWCLVAAALVVVVPLALGELGRVLLLVGFSVKHMTSLEVAAPLFHPSARWAAFADQ